MRKKVQLLTTDEIQWIEGSTAEVAIENGLFTYSVDGVVQVGVEEEHLHSERVIDCRVITDLHYVSNRITKNASLTINRDLFTLEGSIETVRPVYLELLKVIDGKHS